MDRNCFVTGRYTGMRQKEREEAVQQEKLNRGSLAGRSRNTIGPPGRDRGSGAAVSFAPGTSVPLPVAQTVRQRLCRQGNHQSAILFDLNQVVAEGCTVVTAVFAGQVEVVYEPTPAPLLAGNPSLVLDAMLCLLQWLVQDAVSWPDPVPLKIRVTSWNSGRTVYCAVDLCAAGTVVQAVPMAAAGETIPQSHEDCLLTSARDFLALGCGGRLESTDRPRRAVLCLPNFSGTADSHDH